MPYGWHSPVAETSSRPLLRPTTYGLEVGAARPQAIEREALLGFLGYGNARAEAVFVGLEEGLPAPASLAQLAERATYAPIVDLHAAVGAGYDRYLRGDDPPIHPTWNTIVRVLLALEGRCAPTIAEIRRYQCNRLGRATERGALLELYPLPAHASGAWPYGAIFHEFPTRKSYLEGALDARIRRFQALFAYQPKLVIAYGSSSWPHFKQLFPAARGWQKAGQFERCTVGGTHVILAPHFRSRQMNGQRGALIDLACGSHNA